MARTIIARVGDGLYAETPGYVRHVGPTAPADTTGWDTRDLWYDTTDEDASTSGTWRRWSGAAFIPAP